MTSATALVELEDLLQCVNARPMPDLHGVPPWVRAFFHPHTLKEALRFTQLLQRERKYFLLASLLGTLHHQRPGFLSFPSSHLVPYLRSKKFPQAEYPDLYAYRPLAPRLRAKVTRALKRSPTQALVGFVEDIRQSAVESVDLPNGIDCVITSPPYMNALDYGRDNRLPTLVSGRTVPGVAGQRFLGSRWLYTCDPCARSTITRESAARRLLCVCRR